MFLKGGGRKSSDNNLDRPSSSDGWQQNEATGKTDTSTAKNMLQNTEKYTSQNNEPSETLHE